MSGDNIQLLACDGHLRDGLVLMLPANEIFEVPIWPIGTEPECMKESKPIWRLCAGCMTIRKALVGER